MERHRRVSHYCCFPQYSPASDVMWSVHVRACALVGVCVCACSLVCLCACVCACVRARLAALRSMLHLRTRLRRRGLSVGNPQPTETIGPAGTAGQTSWDVHFCARVVLGMTVELTRGGERGRRAPLSPHSSFQARMLDLS